MNIYQKVAINVNLAQVVKLVVAGNLNPVPRVTVVYCSAVMRAIICQPAQKNVKCVPQVLTVKGSAVLDLMKTTTKV